MRQPPRLRTDRLEIIPFGERHLTPAYVAWLNDPAIVRFSELRHAKHTLESSRAYVDCMRANGDWLFALEFQGSHCGNLSVYFDRRNGLADLAILIGAKAAKGKRLGTEAWASVIKHLGAERLVRKVTAGTLAPNKPMLRIFAETGMEIEAIRRKHFMFEGEPCDIVFAAMFIG